MACAASCSIAPSKDTSVTLVALLTSFSRFFRFNFASCDQAGRAAQTNSVQTMKRYGLTLFDVNIHVPLSMTDFADKERLTQRPIYFFAGDSQRTHPLVPGV